MDHSHAYRTLLTWEGNRGQGTATYQAYSRAWRIRIPGKPDIVGCSDPAFRGDPAVHNPEDLLLAALSSCHMLSYLALCARSGISVVSYTDDATGIMETSSGGGRFVSVTLNPRVEIADPARQELALELHEKAHEGCFIASSVNFPVHHSATVTVAHATGAEAGRAG
jgi:organic hydroperoxide reductase OsmC/OhrA